MSTPQTLEQASDEALARTIAASPAGTAHAAEAELYRRFAPRVRLYGLRHLRDADAAQDLAQQVLLVTLERLRANEVRRPEAIGSFILGTSRQMAMSLRRVGRHRQALDARFAGGSMSACPDLTAGLDQPRVEECLRELGERDRAVLMLTFYGERSTEQISEALGVSQGAVRVIRHRAVGRLRECVLGRTRR